MILKRLGLVFLFCMLATPYLQADEEEILEGSKHIISLDLQALFEINSKGNEVSPRDNGSGSGFNFSYQYLFGLGVDINADHAAPLFMFIQKPSFIGADIGINSSKFEGNAVRVGSPFRVDSSSNVYDLQVYGQNYFKNGWGVAYKIRDSITEGARFQIFDNTAAGDTGLEKLDQNELSLSVALNKYLVSNRLLVGLDLGYTHLSGEKPFYTGKKDDGTDTSGDSFNVGFHIDYLFENEKWMIGLTYNFTSLDLDTDVVLNQGGRLTTTTADFGYSVKRDETAHLVELRLKHIYKHSVAFNYSLSYRLIQDDLDNELSGIAPTVTQRDIDELRFAFSPEFWIFNRMRVAFSTGVISYSLSEEGEPPMTVGATTIRAATQDFSYITWFAGMTVDILF